MQEPINAVILSLAFLLTLITNINLLSCLDQVVRAKERVDKELEDVVAAKQTQQHKDATQDSNT